MKANYQIEITVNLEQSGYSENTEKILHWLQENIPVIMQSHTMITDDLFLAPLGHAVSLCLN